MGCCVCGWICGTGIMKHIQAVMDVCVLLAGHFFNYEQQLDKVYVASVFTIIAVTSALIYLMIYLLTKTFQCQFMTVRFAGLKWPRGIYAMITFVFNFFYVAFMLASVRGQQYPAYYIIGADGCLSIGCFLIIIKPFYFGNRPEKVHVSNRVDIGVGQEFEKGESDKADSGNNSQSQNQLQWNELRNGQALMTENNSSIQLEQERMRTQ